MESFLIQVREFHLKQTYMNSSIIIIISFIDFLVNWVNKAFKSISHIYKTNSFPKGDRSQRRISKHQIGF
jgi:hypothetical protein